MTDVYNNPFFKNNNNYKRDFFPLKHYVYQCAYYLHVMTEQPVEVCQEWIKDKFKNKEFVDFNDPVAEYLLRGDNYDREEVEQPLSKLLRDIIKNKEIMAPSLTTYKPENVEKSLLSKSIVTTTNNRDIAKGKMFEFAAEESRAKAAGLEADALKFHSGWFFAEKTQASTKISNNSISGMHNSAANPLFNPSSHSTLTSNCRVTTGYGNANNEKLLMGNRHYWCSMVTMANIISIIANSDYEKIDNFVSKNNFVIPSADQTMEVIEYSTIQYWRNSIERKKIYDLVQKLTPLQRCAFVYTGDLYHIRKFNETYVRDFIGALSSKHVSNTSVVKADFKKLNGDHVLWAHHVCYDEMKGKGKNYAIIENTPELSTLLTTAKNISKTISDYSEFIDTFMMTGNIPSSVARFPDSIRKSAIISDTDSTIFTVQDWQVWYSGSLQFDAKAIAVASTLIALASQSIGHVLATMATNAGIADRAVRSIQMKNEFYFPVAVPTRVAKHYFAVASVQEGNVKDKLEYEIKGVHLKSSNAPPFVNEEAKRMMKEIMNTVMQGKKISMIKILKDISTMENRVLTSLLKGEGTFFRGGQIKTLDSYKAKDTPARTNYFQYMLWSEVFSPKYGNIEPPPYDVYKLSTCIGSPTLTEKWLVDMADQELANRMRNFMVKHGRKDFGTFWIPKGYIAQYGLPVELQEAIGTRHMVADVCKVFYIILETLGYYGLNSKETNLCLDYYQPHAIETVVAVSEILSEEDIILVVDEEAIEGEDEEIDDVELEEF